MVTISAAAAGSGRSSAPGSQSARPGDSRPSAAGTRARPRAAGTRSQPRAAQARPR
jgi:hypothetical protein